MILNETYFGKNPSLLEIEECITTMKAAIQKGININRLPEKQKIENLCATLFGFEKCNLKLVAVSAYGNGMTTPFFYDYSKNYKDSFFDVIKTKQGIRFKNAGGKILYIYIYNEIIRECTAEEVVVCLLHEIGHNFFLIKEQIHYVKQFMLINDVLSLMVFLKNNNFSKLAYIEVLKFLKELNLLQELGMSKYVERLYSYATSNKLHDKDAKDFSSTLAALGNLFSSILFLPLRLPIVFLLTLILPIIVFLRKNEYREYAKNYVLPNQGYNAEYFSDNFAISYGYGANLVGKFSNANEKYIVGEKLKGSVPILRVFWYYEDCLLTFLFAFFDEHPTDMKRCIHAIEKLKFELNNNEEITSSQKIEIEEQIKKCEEILKNRAYYKNGIDNLFSSLGYEDKDKEFSKGYSKESIWDFANVIKGLLKDHIIVNK